MEAYARRFAEASKLAVQVETAGPLGWNDVPPEVMANLLRIVQEALTNVRKHAAAHRVVVRLDHRADGIAVTVEDDGRGFDPEAPDAIRRLAPLRARDDPPARGGDRRRRDLGLDARRGDAPRGGGARLLIGPRCAS